MQDRICQIDEILLQRTAGPYIGSTASGAKSQIGAPISAMLRNRTYAAKLADFR